MNPAHGFLVEGLLWNYLQMNYQYYIFHPLGLAQYYLIEEVLSSVMYIVKISELRVQAQSHFLKSTNFYLKLISLGKQLYYPPICPTYFLYPLPKALWASRSNHFVSQNLYPNLKKTQYMTISFGQIFLEKIC